MNFQRGRGKEPLEINLVPLIDVMMVILIFLMITTTYSKYNRAADQACDRGRRKAARARQRDHGAGQRAGQYVINRNPIPSAASSSWPRN